MFLDPALTCPTCGAPLELLDRATLRSTSGPLAIVKVLCAAGHRFRCPPELLVGG